MAGWLRKAENKAKAQLGLTELGKILTFMYSIEKLTYIIPTTFAGRTNTTSIPTTVVGIDIPAKLVGTVYFDKSCLPSSPKCVFTPVDHYRSG